MRQLCAYAERVHAAGSFDEIEQLLVRLGLAEYLAQVAGGIPMSQCEMVRPADLGLSARAVAQCLAGPLEALSQGNDAGRAELVRLLCQQSRLSVGEDGLALIQRKMALLEEMGCFTSEGLTPKGEFASSIFGYELLLSEMHAAGYLEDLDEIGLSILLGSLVFEPRKGDDMPRISSKAEKIRKTAEQFAKNIVRREFKHHVFPHIKPPHFHLASAIEGWLLGKSFDKILGLTTVDEGEMVRALRMIAQLFRELLHAPHTSEALRQRAAHARKIINRDVVDAEKQLRV